MKKIIFIYERFITIRDYHRFGMEYLEKKGYEVELWRVRREFKPNVVVKKLSVGMYQGKNVHDLSWVEFGKRAKRNRKEIFILYEYDSAVYMSILAGYGCDYFLIRGTGEILYNGSNTTRVRDIKQRQAKTPNGGEIFTKIAEHLFRHHLPQYAFLGAQVNEKWTTCLPDSRKIYVHAWDYDRYLENKEYENEKGEWIVYIDSGFGNTHIDSQIINVNNPWAGKGEKLWNKLGAVFDRLEEQYHMPVVVAGHPHVIYEGDTLCGRKIVLNKTPELMARSQLVIMQWSTAISMVLLFKKDLLVLIDNDFKRVTDWKNYYQAGYKYFGITPCNMDIPEMAQAPWKYVHSIDNKTAQKYIDKYIKIPGTPDKLFIEVIEEKIKEVEKRQRIHKRRRNFKRKRHN